MIVNTPPIETIEKRLINVENAFEKHLKDKVHFNGDIKERLQILNNRLAEAADLYEKHTREVRETKKNVETRINELNKFYKKDANHRANTNSRIAKINERLKGHEEKLGELEVIDFNVLFAQQEIKLERINKGLSKYKYTNYILGFVNIVLMIVLLIK